MKKFLSLAFAVGCALVAFVSVESSAFAQANTLALTPSGAIDQPLTFLPANSLHLTLPVTNVTATATGLTNGYVIPFGKLSDPTYVGGLPVQGTPTTLHFFPTTVQVEYVTLTGATGAAVVSVGSLTNGATSIVNAATAPYSGITAGSIVSLATNAAGGLKSLASGDTLTVTVGTAFAGATVASLNIHVSGYYQ